MYLRYNLKYLLHSTLGVLETEDDVNNVGDSVNTPYYDQHEEDYLDKTHEVGTSLKSV